MNSTPETIKIEGGQTDLKGGNAEHVGVTTGIVGGFLPADTNIEAGKKSKKSKKGSRKYKKCKNGKVRSRKTNRCHKKGSKSRKSRGKKSRKM